MDNITKAKDFLKDQNIRLNDQQAAAVAASDCPTLLLAVPGSGKTATMIARIGYLIEVMGVDPTTILAGAFTPDATLGIKEQFSRLFGPDNAEKVKFITIPELCKTIVNKHGNKVHEHLRTPLEDNTAMVHEAFHKAGTLYPSDQDIKTLAYAITYIKNRMLTDSRIDVYFASSELDIKELYFEYQYLLRDNDYMDEDDQVVLAYRLLREHADILEEYQEKYKYICLDEIQDATKIQHEILKLLSAKYHNIFMVGDDDQSIFGFKAAYPKALIEFEINYPDPNVLFLEENFRCTPQIVEHASRFIKANRRRRPKRMFTTNPYGKRVLKSTCIRSTQYSYIADEIEKDPMETAILFRKNSSVLPFIKEFDKRKISYNLKGVDTGFFHSHIVTLAINLMKFSVNQTNEELFLHVYGYLGCGITLREASEAIALTNERKFGSLLEGLIASSISEIRKEEISDTKDILNAMASSNAYDAVRLIKKYFDFDYDFEKLSILRILSKGNQPVSEFIHMLSALENTILTKKNDPNCKITLTSIHATKGLEYDRVFIVDAIDGITPPEDYDQVILESERRIFYVAATRAKKELILLTYPDAGHDTLLVDQFMHGMKVEQRFQEQYHNRVTLAERVRNTLSFRTLKKAVTGPEDFVYKPGIRVHHEKHGAGEIISITDDVMVVTFDNKGTRKLSVRACRSKGLMKKL